MPELSIYANNQSLPEHLDCQIRSFIRISWFDAYTFDLNASVVPDEWNPTHVVLAEKHALLSYAAVVWRMMQHGDQTYKIYGLSSVLTYPSFRKKGYGTPSVSAATRFIEKQPDADIAVLFTDPELEKLYSSSGWKAIRENSVLVGEKESPHIYPVFTMMLFLSAKGKQFEALLQETPFYFAQYPW
jgi:predicted GNAT family N-acyltransferase